MINASFRKHFLAYFTALSVAGNLFLPQGAGALTTLTVTSNGDTLPAGNPNELRAHLNTINTTNTGPYLVDFNLGVANTITLSGLLPLLNLNAGNTIVIDGSNSGNQIKIDGNSNFPGFFARQGPITLQNLTIQNTIAQGGKGCGGALGAGGGLFIDGAAVKLANITFTNNKALGGAGIGEGGGGMFGGNGGNSFGGGGGIGGLGDAGGGGIAPGGKGGQFSPGFAGGGFGAGPGGTGGGGGGGANAGGGGGAGVSAAGGGGVNGGNGSVNGGDGGYGGGGGTSLSGAGGNGGFGGGGGISSSQAGDGGFGGAGGFGFANGIGGFGAGGMSPGVGGGLGNFGGGAGLGGAIFVNSSLKPSNPSYYNSSTGGGGSLIVAGPLTITNPTVAGGNGNNGNNGAFAGSAIFAASGITPSDLIFSATNASDTITIDGGVSDDSQYSLPGNYYQAGAGVGVSVNKQGAGTLELLGVNFYSGSTIIANGTIVFDNALSLGNPTKEIGIGASTLKPLNNATLQKPISLFNTATFDTNGTHLTLEGQITIVSPAAGIDKTGSGILTLTNSTNAFTGPNTVQAGTLEVYSGALNSPVTVFAGATLEFNTFSPFDFDGPITNDGVVNYTGVAPLNIRSAITGSGSLTLNGVNPGSVFLSSPDNTYTGGTTINSGTLIAVANSLPVNNVVINGGALDFFPSTGDITFSGNIVNNAIIQILQKPVSDDTITLSGQISGTGKIIVQPNAILTLTSVNNSYSGGTFIAGILNTNVANLPPVGTLEVTNQGTGINFTTTGFETLNLPITGIGSVAMSGTGILQFAAANTYTGGTFVPNGTLVVDSSTLPVAVEQQQLSVFVFSTGTLQFNQSSQGTYAGSIGLEKPNNSLIATGAGPLTLSGVIVGEGKLVLDHADVILTNTNAYSGGTQISIGSTLQGNTSTLQGNIDNEGQLIFDQDFSGQFNGTISSTNTAATITKNAFGSLQLFSNNGNFRGTTNINEGSVVLFNVLGGNVSVFPSAILAGNGTVGNHLTNNGIVFPDLNFATLNVNGNYVQGSSGIYAIQIDDQGHSNHLNILGTATLDGTLNVTQFSGTINSAITYSILHANGGVRGFFPNVISNDPRIALSVIYLPNDVKLTVQHILNSIAETDNEHAVASQLTSTSNAALDQLIVLSNTSSSLDDALTALNQMSGEQYTNSLLISEIATRQFIRRLYNPLRTLMVATSCCPQPCEDVCNFNRCGFPLNPWVSDCSTNLDYWMEMGGGRSFFGHDHNAHGAKVNTYEITLGAQMTLDQCWTMGLAGGYEYDNIHYNVGGSGKNNMGLIGLYGLFRPCGYYVLADLAVDFNFSKVKRNINIGTLNFKARSKPHSRQGTFYIEAGKDFSCRSVLVQPFVGFEVTHYTGKKVSETSAAPFNLNIGRHLHTNAYSRVGVHLSAAEKCWALNFDFGWQYRLTSFRNTVQARFRDFGSRFTVHGISIPRNSLDAALNLSTIICDRWELFAEISGEGWSKSSTYSVLAGVKTSW